VLVGGVASGWAGEHSDIRLDLVADDHKAVELVLINRGHRTYRVRADAQRRRARRSADIETARGGVRFIGARRARGAPAAARARRTLRLDADGRSAQLLDKSATDDDPGDRVSGTPTTARAEAAPSRGAPRAASGGVDA
jgi:hypothetical protein